MTHLSLELDAHLARVELVVDLVDDLDLSVVVPGAQRPQLSTHRSGSVKTKASAHLMQMASAL